MKDVSKILTNFYPHWTYLPSRPPPDVWHPHKAKLRSFIFPGLVKLHYSFTILLFWWMRNFLNLTVCIYTFWSHVFLIDQKFLLVKLKFWSWIKSGCRLLLETYVHCLQTSTSFWCIPLLLRKSSIDKT